MRFTYFIFCPSLSSETFFWCAASSAVISLISPQREIRVVSSHHSHVRIYMLCSTASMLVEFSDNHEASQTLRAPQSLSLKSTKPPHRSVSLSYESIKPCFHTGMGVSPCSLRHLGLLHPFIHSGCLSLKSTLALNPPLPEHPSLSYESTKPCCHTGI